MNGLELAEQSVTRMQSMPQGLVKLTAPTTYGEKHLAPAASPVYRTISAGRPGTRPDQQAAGSDRLWESIWPFVLGNLNDSTLTSRRLTGRQLHVCASPEYIEHHGEPHTLSELSHHHCLIGTIDHWRFKENGRSRNLHVSGRFRCNSGNTLRDAARRGLGLVQLPDYYVQKDLEDGHLVEVLSAFRCDPEGIWALYPKNKNLSPKIRLLIDFLAEQLKKNGVKTHSTAIGPITG